MNGDEVEHEQPESARAKTDAEASAHLRREDEANQLMAGVAEYDFAFARSFLICYVQIIQIHCCRGASCPHELVIKLIL